MWFIFKDIKIKNSFGIPRSDYVALVAIIIDWKFLEVFNGYVLTVQNVIVWKRVGFVFSLGNPVLDLSKIKNWMSQINEFIGSASPSIAIRVLK